MLLLRKKTQVLFGFMHCWNRLWIAGSGGTDLFLTLTFFLLFPVPEPLPSAELVSSRQNPCFHFVLPIPPQSYLFSWELTSFAAVQSVPVPFPSDSVFDVLLSGSAGEAELLCPHWKGHPRTDYFCWNIVTCWIALNFVYLCQGCRRMWWSITLFSCSALKEHSMKCIHCSMLWILIDCLVKTWCWTKYLSARLVF